MSLNIVMVTHKRDFKDFLQVPFLLHQKDLNWVPPLQLMTKQLLDKKNPFFKQAEMCLWVAYRDNQPVGRIAGIINHAHNEFYKEKTAFWGFFESENSPATTKALFTEVEAWALSQGTTKVRGPMNPSINYECGLQISAFDTKPFIMMTQNPAYYPMLVEQQDYKKVKDLQAWLASSDQAAINPRKHQHIKNIQKQHNITIRTINMKRYDKEIETILKIYNDAWQSNWGYIPLNLEEFNYLASDLKSIIIDRFVYIAEVDGEPAGFAVGLPNINQIMVRIRNGKLFPFNFLKLLWYSYVNKIINQGRIPMLGVLQKYQHLPIGGMLYCEYLEHAVKAGFTCGEFSWILEDNTAMQAGLKLMGASHYKTYRIYEKDLAF